MIVKLLNKRHLEFLSFKGGCRGPSESTLVKMSNCWKSCALAHMCNIICMCKINCIRHVQLSDQATGKVEVVKF